MGPGIGETLDWGASRRLLRQAAHGLLDGSNQRASVKSSFTPRFSLAEVSKSTAPMEAAYACNSARLAIEPSWRGSTDCGDA